jgi:hypothetical protein
MTPEAQKYLRALRHKDSRKFFEIEEDTKHGITFCILNQSYLSGEEEENIWNFRDNGNPKIMIEFRDPEFHPNSFSVSMNDFERFPDPKLDEFFKTLDDAPLVFIHGDNFDKWRTSPDGTNEDRLKFRLIKSEMEENYKECQEIMKYAESKGWDLKKNDNE